MKNLNQVLSDLVKNSTHIISNPRTIDEMRKRGVKFDQLTPKTAQETINNLYSERKKLAIANISKFPAPPDVPIPTIGFLYDEIRECILFGLYGAAISLSAVLVEFTIKHAIVKKKCGDIFDKNEWDRIENMELGPTIAEAKKLGIIDVRTADRFDSFKNSIRNPYLHYNIKKITKNVVARKVKKIDIKTQKVEEVDLIAEDNPIVWRFAKRFVDRELVFDTFKFADRVIKSLFQVETDVGRSRAV